MRYLALVYGNEEIWAGASPEAMRAMIGRVDAFNRELQETGELISAKGLVSDPKVVRWEAGAPVVSDGPYLEAKEHVGSSFVLDVESHERALEIVRRYPGIGPGGGGVELWPLMQGGIDPA